MALVQLPRRGTRALAVFLVSLGFALPGHAQYLWTGASSSSWVDTGNWNTGTLPANTNVDNVGFTSGTFNTIDQDAGSVRTMNLMQFNGNFTFTGGGFLLDGAGASIFAQSGSTTIDAPFSCNTACFLGGPGNVTVTNPVPPFSAGLTKSGNGQLTLGGSTLPLGPVTVNQGTLTTSQTSVDATRTLLLNGAGNPSMNTGPAYWHSLNGTGGTIALQAGTTQIGAGGNFPGNITGAGELFVSGGSLVLTGNNSFTGGIRLAAGNLTIGAAGTGTFPAGPVTFDAGNGTLTLNPVAPATITTIGAPLFTTPAIVVNGGVINVGPGTWNFGDGNVTVTGGAVSANTFATGGTLTVNNPGSFFSNITNVRGLAGSGNVTTTVQLQVNNAANFTFAGVLAGAGTLTKDGSGTLILSGPNLYSGITQVGAGTLVVNGSIMSNAVVGVGAILAGLGTISGSVAVQAGATIRPGATLSGFGTLNTGNLDLAGVFDAQIDPSGYDRINVTGTVTLNNPTLALTGAELAVPGDQFILITNDGVDAVTGTFAGLPEGATVNFNGRVLRITYVGGDGNDVAFLPVTFNATSSANAGGTISPLGPQTVLSGFVATFTITPNTGFAIQPVTGTCGGSLVGNTFTTNLVVADCTVIANFVLNSYTVTSTGGGANGTITPPSQPVNHGSTAAFTVTPSAGYTASFGGTCPAGSFTAPTYTTGVITGACNVAVTFTLNSYTVTSSGGGANGTITPPSQPVNHGSTAAFTVTPSAGYTASVGGTCPAGTLVGTTYTTGPITGPCAVAATFALNSYTVTASAGANGTITPPSQSVAHGGTTNFTVTPNAGYTAVIAGTCPAGSLVGTTYTTGTITAACTVSATFTLNNYTVTATAGANGTITPPSQTVAHGATTTFTVTPSPGFTAAVGGTCGGTLAGTTYTTNAITTNCTVSATFSSSPVTSFTGSTATGTGSATASFTGGGPACSFSLAQFIPVTGHARSPPAGSQPALFPHGLFDFATSFCTPGSAIVMTIVYPSALPAGTQYWKYGPEPGNPTPHWYVMPATITGSTVVFTITDGSQGDDDLAANGTIVDQGGPGVPPSTSNPVQTPTLSEWALILLTLFTLMIGMRRLGPRPR